MASMDDDDVRVGTIRRGPARRGGGGTAKQQPAMASRGGRGSGGANRKPAPKGTAMEGTDDLKKPKETLMDRSRQAAGLPTPKVKSMIDPASDSENEEEEEAPRFDPALKPKPVPVLDYNLAPDYDASASAAQSSARHDASVALSEAWLSAQQKGTAKPVLGQTRPVRMPTESKGKPAEGQEMDEGADRVKTIKRQLKRRRTARSGRYAEDEEEAEEGGGKGKFVLSDLETASAILEQLTVGIKEPEDLFASNTQLRALPPSLMMSVKRVLEAEANRMKEAVRAARQVQDTTVQKRAALAGEISTLKGQLQAAQTALKEAKADATALQEAEQRRAQNEETLSSQVARLREQVSSMEIEQAAQKDAVAAATVARNTQQEIASGLQASLNELRQAKSASDVKLREAESKLTQITRTLEENTDAHARKLRAESEKAAAAVRAKEETVAELERERAAKTDAETNETRLRTEVTTKLKPQLKAKINELKERDRLLAEKTRELGTLQAQLEAEQKRKREDPPGAITFLAAFKKVLGSGSPSADAAEIQGIVVRHTEDDHFGPAIEQFKKNELAPILEAKAALERTVADQDGKLKDLATARVELDAKVATAELKAQRTAEEADSKLSTVNRDLQAAREDAEARRKLVEAKEAKLLELTKADAAAQARIADLAGQVTRLDIQVKELPALRKKVEELTVGNAALETAAETMSRELKDAVGRATLLEKDKADIKTILEQERKRHAADIKSANEDLAKVSAEVVVLTGKVSALTAERDTLRNAADQATKLATQVVASVGDAKAAATQQGAQDAINQQGPVIPLRRVQDIIKLWADRDMALVARIGMLRDFAGRVNDEWKSGIGTLVASVAPRGNGNGRYPDLAYFKEEVKDPKTVIAAATAFELCADKIWGDLVSTVMGRVYSATASLVSQVARFIVLAEQGVKAAALKQGHELKQNQIEHEATNAIALYGALKIINRAYLLFRERCELDVPLEQDPLREIKMPADAEQRLTEAKLASAETTDEHRLLIRAVLYDVARRTNEYLTQLETIRRNPQAELPRWPSYYTPELKLAELQEKLIRIVIHPKRFEAFFTAFRANPQLFIYWRYDASSPLDVLLPLLGMSAMQRLVRSS